MLKAKYHTTRVTLSRIGIRSVVFNYKTVYCPVYIMHQNDNVILQLDKLAQRNKSEQNSSQCSFIYNLAVAVGIFAFWGGEESCMGSTWMCLQSISRIDLSASQICDNIERKVKRREEPQEE
jgi:hypothetical protein